MKKYEDLSESTRKRIDLVMNAKGIQLDDTLKMCFALAYMDGRIDKLEEQIKRLSA